MERLTEKGHVYHALDFMEDGISYFANKLRKYEDLQEQGLLPKFHLGDEFWVIHYDGVVKEKIVMLQQKKDGTWKYRFKNTCDFEENKFGKEFFDNEEDAEKRWRERYSKYA